MSGQLSRGSAGEDQADERAGVAWLSWRVLSLGFPSGSVVKTPPSSAEDAGLIPGWGKAPGEGNSNPFQYSCLENPMEKRAWRATVHGVTKNQT